MLLLTSTSDAISLITSAASSIDVHASYVDNLSGAITPGRLNTPTISSATTTTIVTAPAASAQRNVKAITIANRNATIACTITLKLTDGTNNNQIISTTLNAGEELIYLDGGGFTQYLSSGAVKTSFNTSAITVTGGTMSGVQITTAAGTTSGAGFNIPAGTNATSAVTGNYENDGVVPYVTPITSERGVIESQQFITMQGGTFTLTSQTAAQKMFNTTTNGAITLNASRSYLFECQFDLSAMSATSGSFGFALGGTATFTYTKWWSFADKATLATAAAAQSTMNTNSTANTALATATTATVGWAWIRGILRVNASGTVIPEVSLGVASAAVVGRDSYFRLWPIGTNTVGSVGNWS